MQRIFLALIVALSVANAYLYVGCYVENTNARDFAYASDVCTHPQQCADRCSLFAYFALSNGGECYCSTTPPFLPKATESDCNVVCPGGGGKCGGGSTRSSVYVTYTSAMGCYKDQGHVLLPIAAQIGGANLERCDYLCRSRGQNTYALAYGGECWCGNVDPSNPNYGVVSQGCNMPCSSNPTQNCGSSGYNKYVYHSTSDPDADSLIASADNLLYGGCHYDLTNGVRDFTEVKDTTGAYASVEMCALFCAKKGNFPYFALQNTNECYCSSHAPNQAAAPEGDCNSVCQNTDQERCGGNARNSVWQRCSNYIGCVKWDQWSLATYKQTDTGANVESCTASCRSKGFDNAFVLNFGACYCTNGTNTQVVSDSFCNMPCNSNPREMCGGDYYHSAYRVNVCIPPAPKLPTRGGFGRTGARSVLKIEASVVDVGGNGNAN